MAFLKKVGDFEVSKDILCVSLSLPHASGSQCKLTDTVSASILPACQHGPCYDGPGFHTPETVSSQ